MASEFQAALLWPLQAGLFRTGPVIVALQQDGRVRGLGTIPGDIDQSWPFNETGRFAWRARPGETAQAVAEESGLLDEVTADGYVFSVQTCALQGPTLIRDAVARFTTDAEMYYESAGQNLERIVWIKARARPRWTPPRDFIDPDGL